jgi:hypothetical protein
MSVIKFQHKGLYATIYKSNNSYCYNVFDIGKTTGTKVSLASGASCKDEFTIDSITKVINEIVTSYRKTNLKRTHNICIVKFYNTNRSLHKTLTFADTKEEDLLVTPRLEKLVGFKIGYVEVEETDSEGDKL